jgi:hypothetical protein
MPAKAKKKTAPRSVREPAPKSTPRVAKPAAAPVRAPKLASVVPLPKRRASIQAAVAVAFDGERVRLRFGEDDEVDAKLAASLDPVVVHTAVARGETVLAQELDGAFVVLGALRTAATPGVDKGDEYVIEARRITVAGQHEVSLTSGAAQIAVRAVGIVETIASSITSRASSVHKVIGRMLHLN